MVLIRSAVFQLEPAKRWLVQGRYYLVCPNESPSARTDIVKRPMSCSVLAEAPLEVWGRWAKHCRAWSFDERSKSPLALRCDRWLDAESCHTGLWQMTRCGVLSHRAVTDDSMRSPVTLGRDRNLTRSSVTLSQDRNSTQSSVTRSRDIVGRRSYVTLFRKNKGRRSYVTLFRKNTGRRSYDILFHKKYKNENIIFISRQI